MPERPSSSRWKRRQASDPFVRRAQAEGWRSRAAFKLDDIQRRDRLLQSGDVVVDLGAAPGAWSQYAARIVGPRGRVIALDLLEMSPLAGVEFIRGDFTEQATLEALLERLGERQADVILSDMAPNFSGNRAVDQPRAMYLAELTAELCERSLRSGGGLAIKLFQGEGFQEFVAGLRGRFGALKVRKPAASRQGNREMYLVARNFRL